MSQIEDNDDITPATPREVNSTPAGQRNSVRESFSTSQEDIQPFSAENIDVSIPPGSPTDVDSTFPPEDSFIDEPEAETTFLPEDNGDPENTFPPEDSVVDVEEAFSPEETFPPEEEEEDEEFTESKLSFERPLKYNEGLSFDEPMTDEDTDVEIERPPLEETEITKKVRTLLIACNNNKEEIPKLQATLDSLHLEMKDYDTRFTNLVFFATLMESVDCGPELVNMVLKYWVGEGEDTLEGVLLDLIMEPNVPEYISRYLCNRVTGISILQVMLRYFDDLAEDTNLELGLPSATIRMPVLELYQKVKRCFDRRDKNGILLGLNREEGRILFDAVKTDNGQLPIVHNRPGINKNNDDVELLYKVILQENPLDADYPDWVDILEGENGLTVMATSANGEYIEPDFKFFIDSVESIRVEGEEINDGRVKDVLETALNKLFINEMKKNKLQPLHRAIRVHGAPNSRGTDCRGAPGGKGPCRMLYCVCLEEDEFSSWYTGRCQKEGCGRKIRNISHAVRAPLKTGGWVGCFCCIDHVYSSGYDIKGDVLTEPLETLGIFDRYKV